MKKNKIYFVWQGVSERCDMWRDGLWAAMKILEKEYDVKYVEPYEEINDDGIVLYWEAPTTINGKDGDNYKRIQNLPNKKILLFAGGPLKDDWVQGFDLLCVESKINAEECEQQGIPYMVAFGINENIFVPKETDKLYYGIHHGTCASWKRQWLVGETLKGNGLVVGRYQQTDPSPFDRCRKAGCNVMNEKSPEELCELMNQSFTCVQTSDYWGGGQRCTLEAMACNIPVICMTDSPKNREYVEESGCGMIVEPEPGPINNAVSLAMMTDWGTRGRDYVMSKWTSKHYADNLKKAICSIQ